MFTHVVVNRTYPLVMMNGFNEGTKVNISHVFGKNMVEITDGRCTQICHPSQIEKIKKEN